LNIRPLALVAVLATAIALAACNGGSPNAPSSPVLPPPGAPRSPIKHVVFVIQENRSFNNLFMGFPGATTQNYGYDEQRHKIRLRPVNLGATWDVDHSSQAFVADCHGEGTLPGTNCRMDGWEKERTSPNAPPNAPYYYVPSSELQPDWDIAKQYVIADRMFASNLDGSFIAHQYNVAAYASRAVNYPVSYWGCEGGPSDTVATLTANRTIGRHIRACFDNPTIGSEADQAGLRWRFYAVTVNGLGGIWSSYQADRKTYYGPDWQTNVVNPPAQFLADIASGDLAAITWITPTYTTSDHAGFWSTDGPAWVASVVNAIGRSKFWKSTAIFIMWDDWGGWYDPVPPVYEDYDGLGFRVPLLMVSPYAKKGYVTHVQYETSSVLRYIEDNFGLGQLAASDARAADPVDDAFDYSQAPRAFKKIAGDKPEAYWVESQRGPQPRGLPEDIPGGD
jgi:phospholipase C